MSPISAAIERQHPADPGNREQQRDVGMVGARGSQLAVDGVDLAVEVVDQPQARVDGAAPRLRDVETVQQLAAGDTEEVRDRARMPEGDQRRVDAVLEHRAVLDEVHPKARQLALTTHPWVGQPDLRHQIAMREQREHARVDPVGLARQRRQALDLRRVGDQDVPAHRFEAVVHEPRPSHRLDHRTDGELIAADPARQPHQAIAIRR
jgi:hypothetical protein